MSASEAQPRLGILDIPNKFKSGVITAVVLNLVQVVILIVIPVLFVYIPFLGLTQLLYILPLTVEHAIGGKMESAKGFALVGAITMVISLIMWFAGIPAEMEW